MPTLQVLDHQPDRSVENVQASANAFADNLYKAQSLKLTAEYYKNLAKQTDNEIEKFHFDRLSKLNNDILPQILAASGNPAKQAMLLQSLKDSGQYKGKIDQLMHDIADSNAKQEEFKKLAASYDPMAQQQGQQGMQDNQYATEGQYRAAQIPNQSAEARIRQSTANLYDQASRQMQGDTGTSGGNASGAQAVGGQPSWMMSGIGPGGPSFVNTNAKQAESYAGAQGTALANKDIALKAYKQQLDDFLALDSQVSRSPGGFWDIMAKGGENYLKSLNQNSVEGAAIKQYQAVSDRLSTVLARQFDTGNLNTNEQSSAKKLVPGLFTSKITHDLGVAFLKDIGNAADSNSLSLVRQTIDKYKQLEQDAKNPGSPRAKAVAGMPGNPSANSNQQKSRYTIEGIE